jgi:hypothetical protein
VEPPQTGPTGSGPARVKVWPPLWEGPSIGSGGPPWGGPPDGGKVAAAVAAVAAGREGPFTVAVGRFERTECNHGGDSCGRRPDPFEETGKDLAGGKRSLRLEPYHPSRAARKNLRGPNRLSQVLPGSKYGPPLGGDPRSEAGAHPGADPQMQAKSPPRTGRSPPAGRDRCCGQSRARGVPPQQ